MRPPKTGLDYFPFDTDLPRDNKIKFVRARFGLKGYAIYTLLLAQIYETNGYYYKWSEDEVLLFTQDAGDGVTPNLVNDVVNECFKRELFDKGIFDRFQILTSNGIQKRYNLIVSMAKLKRPPIDPRYDCRETTKAVASLTSEVSLKSPEVLAQSSEESTQRKGKETKGKESEDAVARHQEFRLKLFAEGAELDRESICMQIKETELNPNWIIAFNASLHTDRKEHKEYHEWLKHLRNWLRLQLPGLKAQPEKPKGKNYAN